MTKTILPLLILSTSIALAQSATGQTAAPQSAPAPQARSEDVQSIESILAATYDVISGPAGKKRDWDRFRSLFYPGARLIPTGKRPNETEVRARVLTPEDYVERGSASFSQQGFFERSVSNKIDHFGNIAHVFSTYESRHNAEDAQPFQRGINSFQLVNDGKRWWIMTIMWQGETAENPIPAPYLKK